MEAKLKQAPIHISVHPSRNLGLMVLTIHAAVLTVVPPMAAPLWGKLLLSLAILTSLVQNLRRYVFLRSPHSIIQLVWENTGEWSLMQRDGEVLEARLLPSTFVHHRLAILNFHLINARWTSFWQHPSVVLFDDAIGRSTLRRLRVRLRTGQQ